MRKVFSKEFVFVVGLAFLFLVVAIIWPPVSIPELLLLAGLVLLCVAALVLLRRVYDLARSYRSLVRRYTNLALSSSRRIEQIQSELRELSTTAVGWENGADPLGSSTVGDVPPDARPIFDPQLVAPLAIKSRPNAMAAGRLAADQVASGNAAIGYRQLLSPSRIGVRRRIAFVGAGPLSGFAKDFGEVEVIHPGDGQLRSGTSYLVIDETAIRSGAWASVTNAQSTLLCRHLKEIIDISVRNGVVAIVVPSEVPDHFSWDLRESATLVLDRQTVEKFRSDSSLPFVRALAGKLDRGEKS